MQVKLFTGNETKVFEALAFDAQSRETDVVIRADDLRQASDRVSDSMADYRWVDVQKLSQKDGDAA